MADKASKDTATKRKVKNPESFRERALKANTEDDKPKRRSKIWQRLGKLFLPLGAAKRAVVDFPPLKPLHKPLRIIGLVVVPVYFRRSWHELKLVTWPGFRQSIRLTQAVLIFAIIFGTAVALVDYGLESVFKRILLK